MFEWAWLGAYLLTAAATAGLGWYYWRHRDVRGVTALAVSALLIPPASVAYAGSLVVTEYGTKLLWFQVYHAFMTSASFAWFLFVFRWTRRDRLRRPAVLAAIAAPLAGFVGGVWASGVAPGVEAFLFGEIRPVTYAGLETLTFGRTAPLAAYYIYSILLYLVGGALLVEFASRPEQRLYRERNLLLALGYLVAVFVLVLSVAMDVRLDLMPITMFIATATAALAIFRFGFFRTVPFARSHLVDDISGGIVVYGTDGRVLDANEVARELLAVDGDPVGRQLTTVLDESVVGDAISPVVHDGGPTLGEGTIGDPEALDGRELLVRTEAESRHVIAQASEVSDPGGTTVAHGLLLSDITDQRRREEELALLKEVFSRTLRHNVRNDMTVIRGNLKLLAEVVDDDDGRDLLRPVRKTCRNLEEMSEKAQIAERLVEAPREQVALDLVEIVEDSVAEVSADHPDVRIETSLPERLPVRGHEMLPAAVENLVENAVEHGSPTPRPTAEDVAERTDAAEPRVSIDAEVEGDRVRLHVADDGPGIPQGELAPLAAREETPLEHGSGIGLWIADWAVGHSGGDLVFETDSGTTATIELDAAGTPDDEP